MNRLDLRMIGGQVALAMFFALTPSSVPPWRVAPTLPPALVLAVGKPVRAVWTEGTS